MGYNTTALQSGYKASGASFLTVGETGCKLTTIKPIGIPASSAGQVQIQTLNSAGITVSLYKYYQGQTRGAYTTDGWYYFADPLGTGSLVTSDTDVVFESGKGLWISSTSDAYSFQTAGEVHTGEVICNLNVGYTMLANPYPVSIKLSSIVPVGLPSASAGQIQIQTLTSAGLTQALYKYYQGQTRGAYTTDGWYYFADPLGTGTLVSSTSDVTFDIGLGLWVSSTSADFSLKFVYNQ